MPYTLIPCVSPVHTSRCYPKNKNASLGPFSGQENHNCSTTQTGLRAVPHDVQGVEGGNGSNFHHNVSAKKRKTKVRMGGGKRRFFAFHGRSCNYTPAKSEEWLCRSIWLVFYNTRTEYLLLVVRAEFLNAVQVQISVVFLGPMASAELVRRIHVALHASRASVPKSASEILSKRNLHKVIKLSSKW